MKPDETYSKELGCGMRNCSKVQYYSVWHNVKEQRSHGFCFLLRRIDLFYLSDHLHWSGNHPLRTLFLQGVHHGFSEFTAPVSTVSGHSSNRRDLSSDQLHFKESCGKGEGSWEAKERIWKGQRGTFVILSIRFVHTHM